MKILTLSDLHMDHKPEWKLPEDLGDFDVAVFAGDIAGSPAEGMRWLRRQPGLEYCEIVFVAGNHEFYHRHMQTEVERANEAAASTRIHFLNADKVAVIDGVRFLGATLWTDYDLYRTIPQSMAAAEDSMNDHQLIKLTWDDKKVRFRAAHALSIHRRERKWLEERLDEPFDGPTVVVTHHCPHPLSIHPRFMGSRANPAFCSDLTEIFQRFPDIDLWLHGHTHDGFDYRVGKTRVVCNPKGYGPSSDPHYGQQVIENALFDPTLVVEVPVPGPDPAP